MAAGSKGTLPPLDRESAEPFYRQIYERFRNAIANGTLNPGDRIPSARALTQELGLARGTIDAAYGLLAAEGYIQARGQAHLERQDRIGPEARRVGPGRGRGPFARQG
ncbi:GntR family transcriptional regulator, partial [Variovorax sp. CT11-76]